MRGGLSLCLGNGEPRGKEMERVDYGKMRRKSTEQRRRKNKSKMFNLGKERSMPLFSQEVYE